MLLAEYNEVTTYKILTSVNFRLNEINVKYVAKLFIRTPYKNRNAELWETFHRINQRDAEVLVEEFEKGTLYCYVDTFLNLFKIF